MENIIPTWAMKSDTERRSRPVALAGDRCGLEQCLFGIELIKARSHSNTAPITRSACCGRKGCYSGSLCFWAAECSWGHAVMVVCVLRKVSLVKGDHCYHASCIKLKASLVVVVLCGAPWSFCKERLDWNSWSGLANQQFSQPVWSPWAFLLVVCTCISFGEGSLPNAFTPRTHVTFPAFHLQGFLTVLESAREGTWKSTGCHAVPHL